MIARLLTSLSNLLDLNLATLSGCSDIIVVKQPDGDLRSTPFHVRFGKSKILQSRQTKVSISVNNRPTALFMYLNAAGEAYFDGSNSLSPESLEPHFSNSEINKTTPRENSQIKFSQLSDNVCVTSILCQGFSQSTSCSDMNLHQFVPLSRSLTLRPTSAQLLELNLHEGRNSIEFSVVSNLQGKQAIQASIYLWDPSVQIVVSDIDGTITKSDILGHIFPIIKKDWSHMGIAALFSFLTRNDYKILYLSSRAIGQADATRHYLWGVRQGVNQEGLPDGPLILNPNRLFASLQKEVVERVPHVFKIAALSDLRSMFPLQKNPFYAGFGNRHTDHLAYQAVGIPASRTFMINYSGVLNNSNTDYQVQSYGSLYNVADTIFPRIVREIATENETLHTLDEKENN